MDLILEFPLKFSQIHLMSFHYGLIGGKNKHVEALLHSNDKPFKKVLMIYFTPLESKHRSSSKSVCLTI